MDLGISSVGEEISRLLSLFADALLENPAVVQRAAGEPRGYVSLLVRGPATVGCAWVPGPGLTFPTAPGQECIAPGQNDLAVALALAVGSYAVGKVAVGLLWDVAESPTAQLVIFPLPVPEGASGPLAYCSRCGTLEEPDMTGLCRCGVRARLRVVPGVPLEA